MIVYNKTPFFDFNPIKEIVVNTSELIEEIRNLQNNIVNELRKPIINKTYIDECISEIEKIILDILDIKNSKVD